MAEKVFTVRHKRTGKTLVIDGESLKDAIKQAGLQPDAWIVVKPD